MSTAQDSIITIPSVSETKQTPADDASGMISPTEIIRISWEGIVRNKIRSLIDYARRYHRCGGRNHHDCYQRRDRSDHCRAD